MKTLYIDCGMGAAGDMLTAALLELMPDRDAFISRMNGLGIPGVQVACHPVTKAGIGGLSMEVLIGGEEETSVDVDVANESLAAAHSHEEIHSHGEGHEHHYDEEHEHHHHHHDDEEHGHHHHHHHDDEEHEHHHHHHDDEEHGHHHHHHHDEEHGHHHHHDDEGHGHHHHHDDEEHGHHHHHTSMADIAALVGGLDVPEKVRQDVMAVYQIIAEAESAVHGEPVEEIHFHEVGSMDAVADVTAVCLLIHELGIQKIVASPIHVGSGHVRCAHGVLPVPAPATALILQGLPIYSGNIRGELCTPTGAALLKHFVTEFGAMPVMRVEKIGYGMGKKEFPVLNAVRVLLGETEDAATDQVARLDCNVDDMTAEEIGFAMDALFAAGAREVFTTSAGMKKNRPGTLITVLCSLQDREKIVRAIFRLTTTIGIRETLCDRYVLTRTIETVDTPYGPIRRKVSEGYGTRRVKYEYDDLAALAKEKGMTVAEIRKELPLV